MMNQNSRTLALGILALLVVIVLVFIGFKYASFQGVAGQLPASDVPVVFIEQGVAEQYFVLNHQLVRAASEPFENGVVLVERAESPVNSEEEVVLASVPGVPGIAAAIRTSDEAIRLLVAGDTNKSDLLVREDGIAIFTSVAAPLPLAEGEAPSDPNAEENTVEETGYATGPVDFGAVETMPFPELVAVNIRTSQITSLGQGYSPRLQDDGSVLAITPEGVMRIDPVSLARTVVVSYAGDANRRGALSPSGMTAALPGAGATLEFYHLGADAAYLGFLEQGAGSMRVSFPDDEHVFVRASRTVARYYNLPTEEVPVATPLASVSIIQ